MKTCVRPEDCASTDVCSPLTGLTTSVCIPGKVASPVVAACPTQYVVTVGGTVPPSSPPLPLDKNGRPACQKPVNPPALAPSRVQNFGTQKVGNIVHFNVPSGTYGLSILSQVVSAQTSITLSAGVLDNAVVPDQLKDPKGALLYNDLASTPSDVSQSLVTVLDPQASTSALQLPNTSAMLALIKSNGSLTAGGWQFTVNDYAYECALHPGSGSSLCSGGATDGQYNVKVIINPASSRPTVDLAIYLASNQTGTTAAAMKNNVNFKRMLDAYASIFSKIGLCVGKITLYDLPVWALTRYSQLNIADTTDCGDFNQLLTLSVSNNTINLYLVDELVADNTGMTTVVGVDGSIPGPPALGGTIHSGAVVSMANLSAGDCRAGLDFRSCGADTTGYIAAHESGHWLGLFHTSERNGDTFDALIDTPQCVCGLCTSASRAALCQSADPNTRTSVRPSDCNQSNVACGGGDNLMFWLLDPPISTGTLSAEQNGIILGSPSVH